MKKFIKVTLYITLIFYSFSVFTQEKAAVPPKILWKAFWIGLPDAPAKEYGVYHFRKEIHLSLKPASFLVHVSADNRYKLYVNQQLVSCGPARGDTYFWNYETMDLAPYLKEGKNSLAAVVWNEGDYRPEAQISIRTGFMMQGDNEQVSSMVNTDESWKCIRNTAYSPNTGIGYATYYVAGPGESVEMDKQLKGWEKTGYNDRDWKNAIKIDAANPKGTVNAFNWMLVPSALPKMEFKKQRMASLRKKEGVKVPASFPAEKNPVTIPANTTATLLLDQGVLTNAYLTLSFSKGKNASIELSYAESMFNSLEGPEGMSKGNRNDVDGKIFAGRTDRILANGGLNEQFTTLSWRTYRYIRLKVSTSDEPLVIDDIYGNFTAYPFQLHAKLSTGNHEMQKILDIGWRTARLCAWETYSDCPYYEQLQYVGDSRIQALVSYYNSGDDLLARNAINQMDHSRIAEGLTLSRHPSFSPQIISTFSLWYIGMLHDYWMYRPDSTFVAGKLEGSRAVLAFFNKYQQPDGSLKDVPYWTFTDWATGKDWNFGMAPKSAGGNSAVLDLLLLWTYIQAAEMEEGIGMPVFAAQYRKNAAQLKSTIRKKYWDSEKQLYADTEELKHFSQHTNSLAILTGMVDDQNDLEALIAKLLNDTSITPCSIYFKYYLHQALIKGGKGNDYLKWLEIWRKNIDMGLTTWAETSDLEHTRSDCHAWGSSPNIEFYRTILGIDSDAPGFRKIRIEPHPGDLKALEGEIPHPNGKIRVKYKFEKKTWTFLIDLPEQTIGTFVWKGRQYPLHADKNEFTIAF